MTEGNTQKESSEWKKPPVLIAFAGLIISVFANVTQYNTANNAALASEQQLAQAKVRWGIEKEKLDLEIRELKEKHARTATDRSKIIQELKLVNEDIAVWDNALFKNQIELTIMEGKFLSLDPIDNKFMIEATKKNIGLQKNMIKQKEAERAAALRRRLELEKNLSGVH